MLGVSASSVVASLELTMELQKDYAEVAWSCCFKNLSEVASDNSYWLIAEYTGHGNVSGKKMGVTVKRAVFIQNEEPVSFNFKGVTDKNSNTPRPFRFSRAN